MKDGYRGFCKGTSLSRLLHERRGARTQGYLMGYTIRGILAWADAHYQRTGHWPSARSGLIPDAPGENWCMVTMALHQGHRGLPGGSSLAQLLSEKRGVRNIQRQPPLSLKQVMAWADAHFQRTGRWPRRDDGAVLDAKDEKWSLIDEALRMGRRGMPGGSSLLKLLAETFLRDTKFRLTVVGLV